MEGPSTEERKHEEIKRLFKDKKPDAITVFSADIVEAPHLKRGFKSASYDDLDARGLLSGAKARVIAAAEAAKYFPNATIVTNTRDRDLSRGRPTHARIYADELQDLGVSASRIELQEGSFNTVTELVETVKLASVRGWRTVAVISNGYQLERIQEMYDLFPKLAQDLVYQDDENGYADFSNAFQKFSSSEGRLMLVKAEDVLLARSPHYARLIREAVESPAHHRRESKEEEGIHKLKTGQYRREKKT